MGKGTRVIFSHLILFVTILFAFECNAKVCHDEHEADRSFRFRYGFRAGLGFGYFDSLSSTTKTTDEDDGANVGGSVGVTVRYENPTRWYFESGLIANYSSGRATLRNPAAGHTPGAEPIECDMSRLALQVPVLAGCKFRLVDILWMSVFAGPTLSVGLTGDLDTPPNLPDYPLYGSDGVWRRFNVAGTFGATFEINRKYSVNVIGSLGLNSMTRADIFHYRNSTESGVQICLTYWLGH